MSKLVRAFAVTGFAAVLAGGIAAPAYADPLVQMACDDDDHHYTVEVLNTEVASVCYD